MATPFIYKKKKIKFIILALLVLLILAVITWERPFKQPVVPANDLPERTIIDFATLEAILRNPILEQLIPFEKIVLPEEIVPFDENDENRILPDDEIIFPEELGRENPFIPF